MSRNSMIKITVNDAIYITNFRFNIKSTFIIRNWGMTTYLIVLTTYSIVVSVYSPIYNLNLLGLKPCHMRLKNN